VVVPEDDEPQGSGQDENEGTAHIEIQYLLARPKPVRNQVLP
jgi:hypothetical protein